MSETSPASVAGFFRNFRRAGVLKNKSRTVTDVPSGLGAS